MHKLFIANSLYVHKFAERERIKQILEGELPLAEHFVVLEKGSVWADRLNPGDIVQIEFGYPNGDVTVSGAAKVLATEKRRTTDITAEHARLNLGLTDLTVIVEKQFGTGMVDFVSVIHLARKGGWRHKPQASGTVEAPAVVAETATATARPMRFADGPLKALLGPRTSAEEPRNPNEHPDKG